MKLLLRMYPRRWRDRYGEEVGALLEATPPDPGDALNLARGAVDAHRRQGSLLRPLAPGLLLVLVDILIGWLNYHAADDVQPIAAALILGGFGFALWHPGRAWMIVLALWVAVPASSLVGYANNYHPGLLKPAPMYETVIALVPAALGAAVGAGTGWLIRRGRGAGD